MSFIVIFRHGSLLNDQQSIFIETRTKKTIDKGSKPINTRSSALSCPFVNEPQSFIGLNSNRIR